MSRLFKSGSEMRVIRIELTGEVTVTAIFFLQAALEAVQLGSYYMDIDRSKMRLYADVFVKTAAEKFSAELLLRRLSREGKVAKPISLN